MKISIKKYHDRLVQEAKKKEADKILNDSLADKCEDLDVVVLYTLHEVFGFGLERCRKFYFEMIDNHFNMSKKWDCKGDGSHYAIMKKRLKYYGIDVEAFVKEADEQRKWRERNEN